MKKFWDFKSKKYPRPFDTDMIKETNDIISIISKLGIDFKDKKIIDIGCGTGIYGLFLSAVCKEVLCLDFSEKMIEVLNEEIIKKNIKNTKSIICDFSFFDITNYKKYFDVAFASMTPAVKTENDLEKMEKLSKKWCIYVGWAGKRENKLADEVYSLFDIKPYIPHGFNDIKSILEKKGKKFETYIFETDWKWSGTLEEAILEFVSRIELDVENVDKYRIEEFLILKYPDKKVEMTTYANKGIIIWEVEN